MGKFATIAVGDVFTVSGEVFKKTGAMTYISTENPVLGEYNIDPLIDNKIQISTNAPAGPLATASAKWGDIAIGTPFMVTGEKAIYRKMGAQTYVVVGSNIAMRPQIGQKYLVQVAGKVAAAPKKLPVKKVGTPAKAITAKKAVALKSVKPQKLVK